MYPFAQRFAETLFRHYPEFHLHAREDEKGNLIIRVPSSRDSDRCIGIVAGEGEVVAGFDAGHGHFHEGRNTTETQAFESVLRLLQRIMVEEVYVMVTERNGRRHRFGFEAAGVLPILRTGERLLYTRSWLGTHDSEARTQNE